MNRDPRADKLLRLAEKAIISLTRQRVDIPVGYAFLVADMRAYLAEPQGEPKHVWRVTWSKVPQDGFFYEGTHEKAVMIADGIDEQGAQQVEVERALVGPWEVVE